MKYIFLCLFFISYLYADITVTVVGNKELPNDKIAKLADGDINGLSKIFVNKYAFTYEAEVGDFKDKILEYYRAIGYYKATIEEEWKTDDSAVFNITENEPIKITEIKYISPIDLSKFVPFKVGDVFTTEDFTTSKLVIKRNFNETGYPKADLDAKAIIDLPTYTCKVIYQVSNYKLSRFGKITISSQDFVNEAAIKNYLTFKEGEVFDIRKLEQSRQLLYNSNIFGNVSINPKLQLQGSNIPTDINVTEGKSKSFGGSLGYDTDESYIVKLFWENRNLTGNMDTLRTTAIKTAVRNYAGIDYSIKSSIGLINETLFAEGIVYPGYTQNHIQNFPKLTYIYGATTHQIGLKTDMGYVVPEFSSVYIMAQNYFINAPNYRYALDKRNSKIDATNGYFYSFYTEATAQGIGSSFRYLKLLNDGSYTINPLEDFILFTRCKFGIIDDYEAGAIPVFERFFAGGVNSNRGYHWRMVGQTDGHGNPIGGQSMIDGSIEARVQTIKSLWLVGFWDMTQLNYQAFEFNQPYYNSVGAGIRYATPIGPIRIDVGVPLTGTSRYPVLNVAFGQIFWENFYT